MKKKIKKHTCQVFAETIYPPELQASFKFDWGKLKDFYSVTELLCNLTEVNLNPLTSEISLATPK